MKKIFVIFIMIFSFVLTGCGNTKKLECKKVYEEYNETDTYSLEYTKDGILKSVTYNVLMTDYIEGELTTSERAELNSECDWVNEVGMKNLKCQVNIKGKDVEMVITATDIDKMTADEIERADLDDFTDYTYDELKSELSDAGYTCK